MGIGFYGFLHIFPSFLGPIDLLLFYLTEHLLCFTCFIFSLSQRYCFLVTLSVLFTFRV